jgi:hypothetical protein
MLFLSIAKLFFAFFAHCPMSQCKIQNIADDAFAYSNVPPPGPPPKKKKKRDHRPFGLTFGLSGQIESGIFFQFGIVSFTATSCTSGLPVGYTEVFPFLNWIKENLKK